MVLVCQSNFVTAIASYLHLLNTNSIKKYNYACVEAIFNQQTRVTWSDMPASILGLFRYSEDL